MLSNLNYFLQLIWIPLLLSKLFGVDDHILFDLECQTITKNDLFEFHFTFHENLNYKRMKRVLN
jgi:hypothetical protein